MSEFNCQGYLRKMVVEYTDPVKYYLLFNEKKYFLNQFLGKTMNIRFTGKIQCVHCARSIKKTFNQGYCFPCFRALAACDTCMMSPERCHYHLGSCRQPEFGLSYCFQTHIVYLANTSGAKVGITRHTQIPTRWIDQGATEALPIAKVQSRLQSGLLESLFKQKIKDKTQWRALLSEHRESIDLYHYREVAQEIIEQNKTNLFGERFQEKELSWLFDEKIVSITYPVNQYPKKVVSINLEKSPEWQGVLWGIKGQYWITNIGVINLRKYSGYEVEVTVL